jgi:hypothetical protein
VACIACVLAVAIPMWNFTRRMLALESSIGLLIAIAGIVVGYGFTAIVPLFYFALYRKGDVPVSPNMRWISMTAATVIGILALTAMPGWIASFSWGDSVLDTTPRPWTISDTSTLLSFIADLAGILLLVALFRLAGDGPSESGVAIPKLLRLLTKIAVIAGGIVAVGCVVGLAATPWVYSYIRDWSSKTGSSNALWTFSRLAEDRIRAALTVMSAYAAPFVIWQGSRTRVTNR